MKNIGDTGEKLVASWLKTQGYQLLHQNWTCRHGEIDLIAFHPAETSLVFVEVKTRNYRNWDKCGILAIDARKQEKITQTAALFLAKNPNLAEYFCRFDVALVGYELVEKLGNRNSYITTKQFSVNDDLYQFDLLTYLRNAFDLA